MDSIFGSDVHSPTAEDGGNQQTEIQASSPFLTHTLDVTETVESEHNVGFDSYPLNTAAMKTGYDVFDFRVMDTTEAPQTTYNGYQTFDPSLHWEPEAIGKDTRRKMTLSRC